MTLVADTSGLVSLASTDDSRSVAVPLLFDSYAVTVPPQVIDELETIATYDDSHGVAAEAILERQSQLNVESVTLTDSFPLDEGEHAVVQLANQLDAAFCYCDEFTQLALIHASLSETRLVTTPRLLNSFVVRGECSNTEAKALLSEIADRRSWAENAYVQQATELFD